jgi:2-iminobutanoate/2-iminopropanoate deaminase
MKNQKPDRRKFLNRGFKAAGVAAAVSALGLPAPSKAAKVKAAKKAIYKAGEKPSPDAIFSPAIQYGNLLFVSGTGPQDPVTHKMADGPLQNQVRQCLENIKAVVEAAGSSMERVLKCTVFLTDMAKWGEMNAVYHQFFPTDPPARSTIGVKDLPLGFPVEIECIAYVG